MQKKIFFDWHLFGLILILSAMVSYFFGLAENVGLWNFLWVCPVVAILTGSVVLLRNNFGISAAIVWVILGPLPAILYNTRQSLELGHIHHYFSVFVLLIILYHLKEIWNGKGFAFGLTTFYGYILLTSYFSDGEINFIGYNQTALYLGIVYIIFSIALLLWEIFDKNKK